MSREEGLQCQEQHRDQCQRLDALQKERLQGQAWDILTNQVYADSPSCKTSSFVAIRPRRLDSRTPYHVINNTSRGLEHTLKTIEDPE